FFVYLDEFPVLTLNDFDTELANLRKTNTGVCITVQDIAFLKEHYGDTALIASNIGTHIVMGHAGWETCKYYSEMSGERYVLHKEFLRKHINDLDFGESPVASGLYPLISPDELKNIDRNSVFVYTKYVNPFILSMPYNLP
ncbi:MAG: TraG/TraD/VirD4 family protein, partial [Deltaproteobacteria bacterium]|nr:TraG/TraD/VirD4 family protein [Deltaproteobacteria bacterium]